MRETFERAQHAPVDRFDGGIIARADGLAGLIESEADLGHEECVRESCDVLREALDDFVHGG